MEIKINIAELLKYCPKGMELYSPIFGAVYFEGVKDTGRAILIEVSTSCNSIYQFYPDGKYNTYYSDSECLIFPSKDQRDWNKFQRPFEDGDVVVVEGYNCYQYIVFHTNAKDYISTGYNCFRDTLFVNNKVCNIEEITSIRKATEEEKQKLFDSIKANGYKWNPKTKTLEKLPRFKVGDRIKHKDSGIYCTLGEYSEGISAYRTTIGLSLTHKDLESWELAPNKFDVNALMPFDKVLVAHKKGEWHIQFFEKYSPTSKFPFICIGGSAYQRCIPYGVNKHLMGTTNDCEEYFKIWEN